MTLYERIGETNITKAIAEFYEAAFVDPIIGHFFHNKNRELLTKMQTDFSINLLGGPKRYKGRPLEIVHSEFSIRKSHFDRRQVLFREVLTKHLNEKLLIDEWLILEENLRSLITSVVKACNHVKEQSVS